MLLEKRPAMRRSECILSGTSRAPKRKLLAFWALKIMAHLAALKRGRYFNPHARFPSPMPDISRRSFQAP